MATSTSTYPTSPDPATNQIYGPTGAAAGAFPAGVYLNPQQWLSWQLNYSLSLQLVAQAQYDATSKSLGFTVTNDPYAFWIQLIQAQLAALGPVS